MGDQLRKVTVMAQGRNERVRTQAFTAETGGFEEVVYGLRYLDISNANRALSPLSKKGIYWKDRGSSDYKRTV